MTLAAFPRACPELVEGFAPLFWALTNLGYCVPISTARLKPSRPGPRCGRPPISLRLRVSVVILLRALRGSVVNATFPYWEFADGSPASGQVARRRVSRRPIDAGQKSGSRKCAAGGSVLLNVARALISPNVVSLELHGPLRRFADYSLKWISAAKCAQSHS